MCGCIFPTINHRNNIIEEFRGQFLQMQFVAVLELYGLIAHLGGGEVRLVVNTCQCRSCCNRGMVQRLSQLAQLLVLQC